MFKDKKVLVLGFARSGYEVAKVLAERGCRVVLNDEKVETEFDDYKVNILRELGVRMIFGSHPDDIFDDSYDYLIKNPGVPIDHKYVLKAQMLEVEVINEVEVAYRLLPEDVKIIAITGTNGKTTTTTLTYEIIKKAYGDRVVLAGNMGYPLCSVLNDVKSGDIIVMELSCQQLENLIEFNPDIAVMTNLALAHIDFFKDYENYTRVKCKIFQNHTTSNIAILNIENDDVVSKTKNIKSIMKFFSSRKEINGCYLKGDSIYYYGEKILSCCDMLIKGIHNIENCICSIMIAKELGIDNDVIKDVINNFKGVEHRLEYVDDVCGRKFYNDTQSTNIKSTQIALSSFNSPIIILLGGLDRGQDFNELTQFMENVKCIVAIGGCRNKVLEYGNHLGIPTFSYEFLNEAFDKCFEESDDGDIILLSPASASTDQYTKCEERGWEFKNMVEELKNGSKERTNI